VAALPPFTEALLLFWEALLPFVEAQRCRLWRQGGDPRSRSAGHGPSDSYVEQEHAISTVHVTAARRGSHEGGGSRNAAKSMGKAGVPRTKCGEQGAESA